MKDGEGGGALRGHGRGGEGEEGGDGEAGRGRDVVVGRRGRDCVGRRVFKETTLHVERQARCRRQRGGLVRAARLLFRRRFHPVEGRVGRLVGEEVSTDVLRTALLFLAEVLPDGFARCWGCRRSCRGWPRSGRRRGPARRWRTLVPAGLQHLEHPLGQTELLSDLALLLEDLSLGHAAQNVVVLARDGSEESVERGRIGVTLVIRCVDDATRSGGSGGSGGRSGGSGGRRRIRLAREEPAAGRRKTSRSLGERRRPGRSRSGRRLRRPAPRA